VRKVVKFIIYLLLVAGAAVFSFPFLWMAATSGKVDREVQAKGFHLMPLTPVPRTRSPYVDERHYEDLDGPYQEELLPRLEALVARTGFAFPPHVNAAAAARQVARGLYEKLRQRLSSRLWDGRDEQDRPVSSRAAAVAALAAAAEQAVTRDMVSEVFGTTYRRLCMGPIRIRSYERQEVELGAGRDGHTPLSARLTNQTPDVLSVEDIATQAERFALLRYDFSRGERFVLSGTFDVPEDFDLKRLHRISVDIRPDDTWHELWLTTEKLGVRRRSQRLWPVANYEVASVQWQEPGPDDASTKIKTWITLEEIARGGDVLDEPHRIKLAFEFRRARAAKGWWNKLALNYQRVLDHMPFGRYLRVSLFLVIANIVLTLLFSSLVAYAFARLNWPGRDFCFILMLATMMIPHQVIMIPQFLIWKNLGSYNTLTPLWLGPVFGNAFFIFLLRQFLKTVPRDLEDAARIDGCGFLRIYWHLMLPLIKPSLAAIAIFTFLGTWNNFMGPLIYIADQRLYPLAFGLYAFNVQVNSNPALTMAGSLLMTVPVIVIFFFAQKYFIQGVTLTGMKA
jgi:ABC-type glycerol-3-phosphate transport system permease component